MDNRHWNKAWDKGAHHGRLEKRMDLCAKIDQYLAGIYNTQSVSLLRSTYKSLKGAWIPPLTPNYSEEWGVVTLVALDAEKEKIFEFPSKGDEDLDIKKFTRWSSEYLSVWEQGFQYGFGAPVDIDAEDLTPTLYHLAGGSISAQKEVSE